MGSELANITKYIENNPEILLQLADLQIDGAFYNQEGLVSYLKLDRIGTTTIFPIPMEKIIKNYLKLFSFSHGSLTMSSTNTTIQLYNKVITLRSMPLTIEQFYSKKDGEDLLFLLNIFFNELKVELEKVKIVKFSVSLLDELNPPIFK